MTGRVGLIAEEPGRGRAPEHPFDLDTSVEPIAEGTYAATLTDRWSTVRGPNGGYCLAVCLRALSSEMPFPDPVSTAAFFHAAAGSGPAKVRTEIMRVGGRLATGEARLIQKGREVMRVTANFTDLGRARGRTLELGEKPLPDPGPAPDLDPGGAFPGATLTDRFDYRVPALPGWRRGRPSGNPTLEFWIRFAEPRRNDPLAISLIADVCPRAVYELGEFMPLTLELTVHLRARPAPGWLAGRVRTRHLRDGYHDEDLEIWDCEGKLVAQSRQLALLPAVQEAHGT
jgi:acyl-CoA thioesterase